MPISTSPVTRMHRSGIRTLMELAMRDPEAIRLEIGEPDVPTPAHVVEAAGRDAAAGHTGYTSSTGSPELREALAEKVRRVNGLDVTAADVVVTHGAMHGLAMAINALAGPGDEILVPDPEFPNWRMAAVAAGVGVGTYPARAANGFVPTLADIEAAITPATRAVVVCSPNNPTGAMYPAELLAGVVELAREHDLWVFSDECYEAITFDQPHASPAAFDTDGRVLTFFSFSKTYAMTGWRLGYVVSRDPGVIDLLGQVAEATVACPSSVSQRAALAALSGPQDDVAAAVASYRERRDAAVALLDARGVPSVPPRGAFYLMVDVSAATTDSEAFALRLLDERHVSVSPGSAFGAGGEGMVRVSLASERTALLEGLSRLADMVDAWQAVEVPAAVREALDGAVTADS
ncbi:pyridoxal phosphate-dependent aminotransferase [Cellulomonas sp. ES6]|uniref:pyridoxal phosphate-dependent aminotransferase n=1 Tax=Cellulomonas sp. ES6 TaxID=3039384 RepID=UPI0024B73145|nr:pyridoxal phosphate-dependent aminotransferase [Cellulomonas sp. ES6]WHP17739.1 pyridoxal phosphate-dependent aminotransferase [Cellulomonas sp. ES6]